MLLRTPFQPFHQFLSTVCMPTDIVDMRAMLHDGTVYSGRFNDIALVAKTAPWFDR
ncbi:hypothetical protein [Terriglobus sp.]|uniref:hypothetical protein n=1 Tax=Terriglobus sp. TaxID=1889013 RepID=UPI003AFFE452